MGLAPATLSSCLLCRRREQQNLGVNGREAGQRRELLKDKSPSQPHLSACTYANHRQWLYAAEQAKVYIESKGFHLLALPC